MQIIKKVCHYMVVLFSLSLLLTINAEDKHFFFIILSKDTKEDYDEKSIATANLKTIFTQDYANYHVIFCDNTLSALTEQKVKTYAAQYNKTDNLIYLKNQNHHNALHTIYNSIHGYCPDNSIILLINEDICLTPTTNILSNLNLVYQNDDTWLTYSDYLMLSSENRDDNPLESYVPSIIENNTFRHNPFCSLTLKTFYARLFKNIKITDLLYSDSFFPLSINLQIGLYLLELSGTHSQYIDTPLSIYNTPSSNNNADSENFKRKFFEFFIKNSPCYSPVTYLFKSSVSGIKYDHISFVHQIMDIPHLEQECRSINKIFPVQNTALCLNEDLVIPETFTPKSQLIRDCTAFSWMPHDAVKNIKSQVYDFVAESNADYCVITETGFPLPSLDKSTLPSLDKFSLSMMSLSDICIIGEATQYPQTLGFSNKYPYLFFIPCNQVNVYMDIKKPLIIIIKRKLLSKALEESPWINGSFLSFLAILKQTYGNNYITCLPVNL